MGKIELEVSIYPTVWTVVLKDHGLPKYEVVESLWATKQLAEARAYQMQADTSHVWEVVSASVGNGGS